MTDDDERYRRLAVEVSERAKSAASSITADSIRSASPSGRHVLAHRVPAPRVAIVLFVAAAIVAGVVVGVTRSGPAPRPAGPPPHPPGWAPNPQQLARAIAIWSRFPVDAHPRPLVLVQPDVSGPDAGFASGAAKQGFLQGEVDPPTSYPGSPSHFGGWPIISARAAFRLTLAGSSQQKLPAVRLRVSSMQLGWAVWLTDRGKVRLPTWSAQLTGANGPIEVLAVAPSAQFVPPAVSDGLARGVGAAQVSGMAVRATVVGAPAGTGPCDARYRLHLVQTSTAVIMFVQVISNPGSSGTLCALPAVSSVATATMSAPLGARVLVDGATATAVAMGVLPH